MRLPDLGVGIVYHPGLRKLVTTEHSLVDVLEIEPQTEWRAARTSREPHRIDPMRLEELAKFPQPTIVHSVGAPVGGSRPPDGRQIAPLVETIAAVGAPWASEHLAFNRAAGPGGVVNAGFLLPPRQTWEGALAAARTVREFAERLPVPLAVETAVNYLHPRDDELADGEFVDAVVTEAECGILLDLHNVWTNARNGRQRMDAFLESIPLDRVWEVHLAGGCSQGAHWLDAHCDLVPPELMTIARDVIPALPQLHAIVFELLPEHVPTVGLARIERQLAAMHELWALRRPGRMWNQPPILRRSGGHDDVTPGAWEDTLGSLVGGLLPGGELAEELGGDPGVHLLQNLAREARAGMIVTGFRFSIRLLMLTLGPRAVRHLVEEFCARRLPEAFAAIEGLAFADFLRMRELDVPWLAEVLAFETALLRAAAYGEVSNVKFSHEPERIFMALDERRLPEGLPAGEFELTIDGN